MTQLGKVLVFVTVALSFLMLSWAAGLYLNHLDFAVKTPKPGDPPDLLKAAQARIDVGKNNLEAARLRWEGELKGFKVREPEARAGLLEWEKRRDADYAWYQEQLNEARSGRPGKAGEPNKLDVSIKRIANFDPSSSERPTLDEATLRKGKGEGRQPGDELFCYDYYTSQDLEIPDDPALKDKIRNLPYLSKQLRLVTEEHKKAMQKDSELTDQIIGPKGLRQQIIDEQEKIARIDEELKNVVSRKTNSGVETELLRSRHDQLQRRIKELKRTAADERQ